MLEIDVSRGEKVILPVENCTASALANGYLDRIDKIVIRIYRIHSANLVKNPVNPVTAFYSQSRVLFDGGLFDKLRHRFPRHWITIEFVGCRVG